MEKIKIENKELKSLRRGDLSVKRITTGDNYDKEDEIELDSERDLIRGKQQGFRRVSPQVQSEKSLNCTKCGFQFKTRDSFERHIKQHEDLIKRCNKCGDTLKNNTDLEFHTTYEHRESVQWNCNECSYQSNNKDSLKNHINFKHTIEINKEVFEWEVCARQFRSTWHLRNHTRDEHGKNEECVHFKQNRCKFGDNCWKKHSYLTGAKSFVCYSCKDTFKNMNELMEHRNLKHIEMCKPCEPKNGICRYQENPEKCWFVHKDFPQAMNKPVPP